MNRKVALWGISGRYEGLFAIIYYFSLMFLSEFISEKYKKIIVNSILISGMIQCIYALCQIYEVKGIYRMIHTTGTIIYVEGVSKWKEEIWATGFITNPNFFGTYMLLCESYSLGLYIDEKRIIKKIIYIIMSALFFVGVLISNATSCAVGLIVVLLYILIYCIKNKYLKKIMVLAIICTVIIIGVKTEKTKLIQDLSITGQQATEIAKGNVNDFYGSLRIYVWKETLKIVPQNLIHGVGIDNFSYAFNGKPLFSPGKKVYFDKAHNEYLQTLVTQGIFCAITYVVMYATIGIKGVIRSYKSKEIYLILPVIGYLVQAFFNISVIEVAPIFFIALGLCMEDKNKMVS